MKTLIDLDEVCLPDDIWYPLIVCSKTNIFYTVQAGGGSCDHPEAEGFVLRIRCGDLIDFNDCDMGCWHSMAFDDDDYESIKRTSDNRKIHADLINKCLSKYEGRHTWHQTFVKKLEFNYDKIDELLEGWWPVKVTMAYRKDEYPSKILELDILEGYIHAGNCD